MLLALATIMIIAADAPNELPVRKFSEPDPRQERQLAIAGELGWNGLSGLGANVFYYPLPHLCLDGGLGLASTGFKVGLRARANLFTSNFTPFIGTGILYGFGTMGKKAKLTSNNNTVEYKIRGSPYIQGVAGIEYMTKGGFTFMANAGYAWLLHSNIEVVSGSFNSVQKTAMRIATDSGIVISLSFGYAFATDSDNTTNRSQD
ncbi:MAG: hypothetical protein JW841_11535 [Deltaproteobacteria bacterium]|nr:hypothetical protein [Deltaproteobacteria bacterium]